MTGLIETEDDLFANLSDDGFDFLIEATQPPSEGAGKVQDQSPIETQAEKRRFEPNLLRDRGRLQTKVQEWLDKELVQKLAVSPELTHASLKLSVKAEVRIKSTPKSGNALRALLQRILSAGGALASQTEIRDFVSAQHPTHNVYRDWTVLLPVWAIKEARSIALCSGPPFNVLKIRGKMSLREIHAAARYAFTESQGETLKYRTEISLSERGLTINGHEFKITKNRSCGKEYQVARINIDSLKTLLMK